jgi:hypothetical protein
MSRTNLLACMWITWAVLLIGGPFTGLLVIGSGINGSPWPFTTFLGFLAAFACDAVAALVLTGVALERDGKLLSIRVDWIAPVCLVGSLLNMSIMAVALSRGPDSSVPAICWPIATFGLPITLAVSGSWFARRQQSHRAAVA